MSPLRPPQPSARFQDGQETSSPGSMERSGGLTLYGSVAASRCRRRWRRGTGTGKESRLDRDDDASAVEAAGSHIPNHASVAEAARGANRDGAEAAARGASRDEGEAVPDGNRGERAAAVRVASHAEEEAEERGENRGRPARDGKAEGRGANRGAAEAGAAESRGRPVRVRRAAARRGTPVPGARKPRWPASERPVPRTPELRISCR